jgi:hypothetical protein
MLKWFLSSMVFLGILIPDVIIAQDDVSAEAGAYARKSITYINAVWLMDQSAHNISNADVAEILDNIKSSVFMSRFDYNPVPQPFISDFMQQLSSCNFTQPEPPVREKWEYSSAATDSVFDTVASNTMFSKKRGSFRAAPDPMLDSVIAIMERTIVPKILEVVDLNKESRANNLTSERQRNSFMANKAKSMGITMDDVNKVMNSAYIFLPMVRNYKTELEADSIYTVSLDIGVVWFRISTTGDKARAIPVMRKFITSTGLSKLGKSYISTTGMLDYQHFAFSVALKNAASNMAVATQKISEFNLSGQVLEKRWMSIGFNLGKNEGIKLDDKYSIVEFNEDADGKIVEKKNGWVFVTAIGDSNSKEGYKSKARVIAGAPYIGEVVREYPRLPLEIVVKGKLFAFAADTTSTTGGRLTVTDAVGFQANTEYNIGRTFGINQLFVDLGFGLGYGSASGEDGLSNKIESCIARTWEFSLVKKFYIGRCALIVQPLFGMQDVMISTKKDQYDVTYRYTNSSSGFAINGSFEYALSPACNFGLGTGYQMYGKNNKWYEQSKNGTSDSWSSSSTSNEDYCVNHTGVTAQVYITWSLPGLSFDPLDAVRGLAGY